MLGGGSRSSQGPPLIRRMSRLTPSVHPAAGEGSSRKCTTLFGGLPCRVVFHHFFVSPHSAPALGECLTEVDREVRVEGPWSMPAGQVPLSRLFVILQILSQVRRSGEISSRPDLTGDGKVTGRSHETVTSLSQADYKSPLVGSHCATVPYDNFGVKALIWGGCLV